ncbi:unnamed protein product [Ectocarpus sp. 4 AP-2014]
MERNAFASLFSHPQAASKKKQGFSSTRSKHVQSSAKRPRSSPSPSAASPSGSRFVECPLCAKSVHSSLAQTHVERCPGSAEEPISSAAKQVPPAAASAPSNTLVFSSPRQEAGVKADACVAASLVNRGRSSAERVSPIPVVKAAAGPDDAKCGSIGDNGGEKAGAAVIPPPSISNGDDVTGDGRRSRGRRKTTSCSSGEAGDSAMDQKNDAFATLMAASALTNFREEMYLLAHQDGTLSWGWGPAGNPLPPIPAHGDTASNRWRCQVATKGPDGRKAGTCDIWTNLAPAESVTDPVLPAAGRGGDRVTRGVTPAGGDDNAGLKAARPAQSLSRLPVAVVKSMLQKNIRRGRAEAAVRCALELALKSWSDAIRRVLVIVVEDSLLHPAAPLLSWLMVATSKGYRPPPRLLEAFLCVVHETAACPVRDSTDSSCRRRRGGRSSTCVGNGHHREAGFSISSATRTDQDPERQQLPVETKFFDADEFPVPHPKSLLVPASQGAHVHVHGNNTKAPAVAPAAAAAAAAAAATAATTTNAAIAVANIRRALLMRVSYGGMACDQALLKGVCLAWGERSGHCFYCCCRGTVHPSFTPAAATAATAGSVDGSTGGSNSSCLEGEKASTSGEGTVLAKGGGSTDEKPVTPQRQPPSPPRFDHKPFSFARPRDQDAGYANHEDLVDILQPFGYAHESVLSALEGDGWTAFLVAAHAGTGMPPAIRTHLLAHVVGVGSGRAGERTGNMKQKSSGGGGGAGGGGGGGEKRSTAASTSTPPNCLGPIIREADAILSGVDFHCSGVLDELLRSTAVAARVGKAISESRGPRSNDIGTTASSELVGVRQAAKQAMWACSSGINTRRLRVAFLREAGEEGEETEVVEGDCGCCLSSSGYLEETERVVGVGEDGVSSPVGNGGGSSSGMDARVWAAMSSDVSGWATKFVRGRLSRG